MGENCIGRFGIDDDVRLLYSIRRARSRARRERSEIGRGSSPRRRNFLPTAARLARFNELPFKLRNGFTIYQRRYFGSLAKRIIMICYKYPMVDFRGLIGWTLARVTWCRGQS